MESDRPAARVQGVPQTIAQEIDAEHRQQDQQGREEPQPGSCIQVIVGTVKHVSPSGGGGLYTETKKTNVSLRENGVCHAQGGGDDNGSHAVGENMQEYDPPVSYTHLRAHETRHDLV